MRLDQWWAYAIIFYGGVTVGFILCALLTANHRGTVADEAEAWLRKVDE